MVAAKDQRDLGGECNVAGKIVYSGAGGLISFSPEQRHRKPEEGNGVSQGKNHRDQKRRSNPFRQVNKRNAIIYSYTPFPGRSPLLQSNSAHVQTPQP
jgi:hypothetical protein